MSNYLEDWSNVIKNSSEQEREGVKKWFDIHKPIKRLLKITKNLKNLKGRKELNVFK